MNPIQVLQHRLDSLEARLDRRCQRPDGTYYGTSGKCKKGSEVGATGPKTKPKASTTKKPAQTTQPKSTDKTKKQPQKQVVSGIGKPPTAKQIAAQEAKTQKLLAKIKGPGGSKYVFDFRDARQELEDMKLHAADPAQYAQVIANRAKEEKEQKEKLERWGEMQRKLDARQHSVYSQLSKKDFQAIKDYTDEAGSRPYTEVNECARKKSCMNLAAKRHIRELDAALKKLPANEDADAFYRGVSVNPGDATEKLYRALEKAKPGTTLKDPGFGSYSSKEQVAEGFMSGSKNIKFVNRNKELRALNVFSSIPDEYEALLPRGVSVTIRRVTKDGDTLIVELD